jgi:Cysteine-rich CWC
VSTALAPGDNARCARCAQGFHCGAGDTAPCACSGLTLSPDLQARLRALYSGCLCLTCLRQLAAADTDGRTAHPR